jgi:hypothetical protein
MAKALLLLLAACLCALARADSTALAPSVSSYDVDFKHDDIRCTCSCPLITVPLNGTSQTLEKCAQVRQNYTVLDGNQWRAQETCKMCKLPKSTTYQCNYIVVLNDEDQCQCQNILPSVGEGGVRHTKIDCGICACIYEFRNQNLIHGIVVFYFVILGCLLSITAFNMIPHRLFTLKPYGLSLRDPDMPLPKLYSPRSSRSGSPSFGERQSVLSKFAHFFHLDMLRRTPRVRDIGY